MKGLAHWSGILFLACLVVVVAGRTAHAQKALPPPPTLEAAYIRERIELLAEKQAMQEQLDKLTKNNEQRETIKRSEVDALTLALADARREADDLEGQVAAAQEEEQVTVDRSDVVDSTLEIAGLGLRKLGYELSLEGRQEEVLRRAFAKGVEAVREKGTVHLVDGAFFDTSGVERKGKIVHVGRVAALGFSEGMGGTLMPAPGGGLTVVDSDVADAARRIAEGEALESTPVHLFDPMAGAHEHRTKRSWLDLTNAGGTIAWLLVGLGAVVLLIVAERVTTLALTSTRADHLMRALEKGLVTSEKTAAAMLKKERGALARVLRSVLLRRGAERAQLEDEAAEAIYREMPRLERLLPFLAVIAGVAPMLGLLGTVTGMISTFEVITEHGTGDPKLLSGGISEALITTEFGLIVAIPALMLHNLLARWSDRIVETLQSHALSLINILEKQRREAP